MKNIHPKFEFYRGGTAVINLDIPTEHGAPTDYIFTLAQNYKTVITKMEFAESIIGPIPDFVPAAIHLTEAETAQFQVGDVDAQVRYTTGDGKKIILPEVHGKVRRTQEITL